MFLTGFIRRLKNVFALPRWLIKMFHLQQSSYLRFFLSSYLLPTYKKNHYYIIELQCSISLLKKQSRLQHLQQSGHLEACKMCDFFLLIFLGSSPPSTTTLKSPHSLLMNTSQGKFSKFPMPSISIPSSFSSGSHNNIF